MAEWVKDPTTDKEQWHRVARRVETNILVMVCGKQIPDVAELERGPEAPAANVEHQDCREAV